VTNRAAETTTIDGNEAAAHVAYQLSDVIAIYPITPASPMGELCDAWSAGRRPNRRGAIPQVIEMQSEGGAAGAVHGSLQAGAMTTTFTASQGLLLMIPNLYKMAGELTPTVIHVAARAVATHALSIFGDHSDVMAARQTGAAMLASASVQEAQDLALVAHAATLRTRVPFLHFFDGFRTSHEVAKIDTLPDRAYDALIDAEAVAAHLQRSLDPNRPVLRGTAQNPDVFFQSREAANPFHDAVPDAVQAAMDQLADVTGRRYQLFDYEGADDAEDVMILMGSGTGAASDWLEGARQQGRKVGVLTVRLFRPFSVGDFVEALPLSTKRIAVLDRTKEPGSVGEPLYGDVCAALVERWPRPLPLVIGGRYGLGSKEFTPAMVEGVFRELAADEPRRHVTVGITDDVTGTSVAFDREAQPRPAAFQAVFFGLGSDGTVGANKTTAKIVGDETELNVQGYFVYDSKKSGAMTVSHLRFDERPITATYLIDDADFVGCHRFSLLERADVLARCRRGGTLLLNTSHAVDELWERLPAHVRADLSDKEVELWAIDANAIAADAGIAGRVNTVLQACFFSLTDVLDVDTALAAMKTRLSSSYGRQGAVIVERNSRAIDQAISSLRRVPIPTEPVVPTPTITDPGSASPELLDTLLAGHGDLLPVSALPVDGTFPTGTAKFEKRGIAAEIPIWDAEICIDCGRCALVCPHAAIRMKVMTEESLSAQPSTFQSKVWKGPEGDRMTIQVAPDDCTGCGVCVDICPAKSKTAVKHRAINMEPVAAHVDDERANFEFFLELPEAVRTELKIQSVKGSQLAEPLFEFSGACAGCGETPYLKLLSQLFGDRTVIANATGCSSIYGGNLPTTPWTANDDGRGPAWANSLFEDNAEFGLGMRLALDSHERRARALVETLAPDIGESLASALLGPSLRDEDQIAERRRGVDELRSKLADRGDPAATELHALADHLVRSDVWIVGGDGWAYDIGFAGVDHVLASGADVNILVLDTEVYSNTGGQTSKSTPRAAVAKFSTGGKTGPKKDLGMLAMAYGDVFVAQIAMGANMTQTVKAFHEAAAHPGPSLIIAYSPCIAHGIDMTKMMRHQRLASETGYWPLYRYDPAREAAGDHGLHLDSRPPTKPFRDFARSEGRFASLERSDPATAAELFDGAQTDIDNRWHLYEQMVNVERVATYATLDEDDDEHDAREGQ